MPLFGSRPLTVPHCPRAPKGPGVRLALTLAAPAIAAELLSGCSAAPPAPTPTGLSCHDTLQAAQARAPEPRYNLGPDALGLRSDAHCVAAGRSVTLTFPPIPEGGATLEPVHVTLAPGTREYRVPSQRSSTVY